jgi:proteic killer suppression protein
VPDGHLKAASRKLDQITRPSRSTASARRPPTALERLKGDRQGQYSIRINDQYRVYFTWTDACATDVAIADYH